MDGSTPSCAQEQWFIDGMQGKRFCGEPYIDARTGNSFVADIAVPVYDDNKKLSEYSLPIWMPFGIPIK